jgi:hypothetical protein
MGGNLKSKTPYKGRNSQGIRSVDTREIENEFNAHMKLYHGAGEQLIEHHVLSLPVEDNLTDAKLMKVTQDFLKGMGVDDSMKWVAARHSDTDNPHVHIILCRTQIKYDESGSPSHYGLLSDKNDYERGMLSAREVELKHGLTQTQSPGENQNNKNQATIIRAIGKSVLEGPIETLTHFVHAMALRGVEIKPAVNKDGDVSGLSYRLNCDDGRWISGSKVMSTVLTLGALAKRLDYLPKRDDAALGVGLDPRQPIVSVFERGVQTATFGIMTRLSHVSMTTRKTIDRLPAIKLIERSSNYYIGILLAYNFYPPSPKIGSNEMAIWEQLVNSMTQQMLRLLKRTYQNSRLEVFYYTQTGVQPSTTASVENLETSNFRGKLAKFDSHIRNAGLTQVLEQIVLLANSEPTLPESKLTSEAKHTSTFTKK